MNENQIRLRGVRGDDLPRLLQWWATSESKRALRVERFNPSPDDVERLYRTQWQDAQPDKYVMLIIEFDGHPVGELGYHWREDAEDEMEVHVKIGLPELWGRGIGTQAMQLLVARLFAEFPIRALFAEVGEWNWRGLRLFAKCGFTEVAREQAPANEIFDGGVAVVMRLARHGDSAVRQATDQEPR